MKKSITALLVVMLSSAVYAENPISRTGFGATSEAACIQGAERLETVIKVERKKCEKSGRTFVTFPDECAPDDVSSSFGKPQFRAKRVSGWVCE